MDKYEYKMHNEVVKDTKKNPTYNIYDSSSLKQSENICINRAQALCQSLHYMPFINACLLSMNIIELCSEFTEYLITFADICFLSFLKCY